MFLCTWVDQWACFVFVSLFAFRLHSSVLCFEHCGVLWECFGEPGDPFVLNLRLWRVPGDPSGPHLEYESKKTVICATIGVFRDPMASLGVSFSGPGPLLEPSWDSFG